MGLIQGLALLIFISCEEPGRIGIEVDPENLSFTTTFVDFNLTAKLIPTDSLITGNAGKLLVGKYDDPQFGKVEAKSYAQVWRSGTPNFGDDSVYDSLILQLPYATLTGTEVRELNDLKVFRLEEDLDQFIAYYNFTELTVSDEPIGETSFRYVVEDIDGEDKIKLDTLLRMHLSDDLGMEFFEKAKDENDSTFSNDTNFLEYFKGISLEAGANYNSVTGFDHDDDDMSMILYYHIFDTDGNPVSINYTFRIKNFVHFNNIKHDWTGTALEGIEEPYKEHNAADNFLYLQSGTGLAIKYDLQPFVEFADSVGFMIINLGRLTLGKVDPYTTYLQPPSTLIYYFSDSTNRRSFDDSGFPRTVQQDNPSIDATGGQFALNVLFKVDDGEQEFPESYSDRFSNTLQAIADGRIENQQILVIPLPTINSSTVNRFRLDPQNIKLEVYYTTSNESSDFE